MPETTPLQVSEDLANLVLSAQDTLGVVLTRLAELEEPPRELLMFAEICESLENLATRLAHSEPPSSDIPHLSLVKGTGHAGVDTD